jgi:DNA mismatch endonuclease (patch repair protein)
MKRIGRANTAPELAVRRHLHARGFRYRLHVPDLPGTPDIVLPRYRTVVFVHGCFWHGHDCPHGAAIPRSNPAYWSEKIARNRRRDERKESAIGELGWHVEVVWECEADDPRKLTQLERRIGRRKRP